MRNSVLLSFWACMILNGCGSGSSGLNQDIGYTVFSESAITIKVNSTKEVTVSIISGIKQSEISFYSPNPAIVGYPATCELNNATPQSCNIVLTGLESGVTTISNAAFPGQPLIVTVEN